MNRLAFGLGLMTLFAANTASADELKLNEDRGTLVSMTLVITATDGSTSELLQFSAEELSAMGQVSLQDEDYGDDVVIEKLFFNVMYPDHYVKSPVHSRPWVGSVDALIWDTDQMSTEMVDDLGTHNNWRKNFGMIVLTDADNVLYHTICLTPGHSGDDQGAGNTW